MNQIRQRLLDAASEVDTVAITPPPFRYVETLTTTHTIEWGDGVSSGVVEIEAAANELYSGTWSSLATVTFSGTAPKVDVVVIPGSFGAIQHRISTPVTDGTVTTKIEGAN